MRVQRVEGRTEELLDPTGAAWQRVGSDEVSLSPTPIEMQPTEYARVVWQERPYGKLSKVSVQTLHNGERIFFRLTWEDATEDKVIADINQFTDAAAVLFPVVADAPMSGMGVPGKPVNAWLWRPDWPSPRSMAAEGVGSTRRRDDPSLAADARYEGGRWQVVISRAFAQNGAPAQSASLSPGTASKVGFAVWEGGNQERAGIKAFSVDWIDLQIDA